MKCDNENFLYKLPDELLLDICYRAGAFTQRDTSYKTKLSLTLVSSRLNRLATPLLYQHLRARRGLDAYWAREKPKSRSLHQTLERNPSLGAHCKSLQLLNIRNLESQTSFVHNICSWLPNVKYLSLEQDTTEPVSDVLNASLQRLPQLEELDCKCHWAKPTEILASIYAEARTLRRLSISGGRGGDSVRSDRAVIYPCIIRSLHTLEYAASYADLRNIVRHSHGRQHFRFTSGYKPYELINFAMISSMLLVHSGSLRTLTLGPNLGGGVLDLSGLVQLQGLHLHQKNVTDIKFTDELGHGLLAPNLKLLRLDFGDGCGWEKWASLSAGVERWVKAFADYAAKSNSSLAAIYMKFTQTPDFYLPDAEDVANGYPWDRMRRIKSHLGRLGIRLGYPKPSMTKEQRLEYTKVVAKVGYCFPDTSDCEDKEDIGFGLMD